MPSNWDHAIAPPQQPVACSNCGEERLIEYLMHGVYLCNVCSRQFTPEKKP